MPSFNVWSMQAYIHTKTFMRFKNQQSRLFQQLSTVDVRRPAHTHTYKYIYIYYATDVLLYVLTQTIFQYEDWTADNANMDIDNSVMDINSSLSDIHN